ncbi:unnamed protein product [Allacma fusca]|uniref:Palmitoyl-protein thioesterase 1 n=1 Tax=Allacma fusca TaxID=39272 RepID=A0A8J2KXH2_9HEXA|nr:unnamed protein product [Allacma fusca]
MPVAKSKASPSAQELARKVSQRSHNTPLPQFKLVPDSTQKNKSVSTKRETPVKKTKKRPSPSNKKNSSVRGQGRGWGRKSQVAPVNQSSTIIRSGGSVVQAPLIYGEIPPSLDTSKLKLSIKQIFMKKNREYPKLPKAISPTKYFIGINPELDLFSFTAVVLILAQVRQPVQKIVMNSVGLQITSVFVYKNEEEARAKVSEEDPKKSLKFVSSNEEETLEITMPNAKLRVGTCAIKISFKGTIVDQMKGFHYSKFTNLNSKTFYTYLTKCQPCDARRIFPCFDEPEYKAKFSLSLTVPKKATVLANMPEKESKKIKKSNFREVVFEETPPMPTFLFAFVIGKFNFIRGTTSRGVKVRVFTPAHAKKREGKFALNTAIKAIDFMETFTGIPYSQTKMDLVPIEEMNIESQCNLGLCMFRDDAILILGKRKQSGSLDESPSLLYQKIALLVSRAVVEQWVENKVTLEWWSDVWLNVGLGTFLQYLCVQAIIEDFQYDLQDPPDIEETYDEITSDKGASILRMLYSYVGFQQFQKGLTTYIKSNENNDSKADSLWNAIETESDEDSNLVDLMLNWTLAKGYPLIMVTSIMEVQSDTAIKANQQRFASTIESAGKKTQGWEIPLRVICSTDPSTVAHTEIIRDYQFTVNIPQSGISWVVLNSGRSGYFRVGYAKNVMEKITSAIKLKEMRPMDRLIILQDMFAMAISGYSSVVDLLQLLQAYIQEDDYHVWRAIDDIIQELDCYISYSTKESYERFQQYILAIYKNIERIYGKDAFEKKHPPIHEYTRFIRQHFACLHRYDEPSHKKHVESLMFGLVIKRMCLFGHVGTLEWAKNVFISSTNDESDVHPDIYPAVAIGFSQWKDNEENLHLIFRAYRRASSIQEKEIIMEGFTLFRANTHIRKILQFAISDNVTRAHAPLIMARCSSTKLGRHMSWYFFKEHIAHFSREYYQNEQLLRPIFRHILSNFMTDDRLQDVQGFFKEHGFQGLQRTVEETLDCIRRNIAWAKRDLLKVNTFLVNLQPNELVDERKGNVHITNTDSDGQVDDDVDNLVAREIETNSIYGSSAELQSSYVPIVYWHGMGDNAVHVKSALNFITRELPGVYVVSLQIGPSIAKDTEYSYFYDINKQVALVCEAIKNDTHLQAGYNAIGLSQGGQFLRAVAQRCPDPPMKNLISLGGQHQGVFGIPRCSAPDHSWCEIIDKLLTNFAYEGWVQSSLVQAAYWHDPFKNDVYIENSIFLADINNERTLNQTYKENLLRLENLVLVLFENETVVQPKESEWFGFYEPGQDKKMVPLQESTLYKEDRIGLRQLNESGRLHLLSSEGNHLAFTKPWFIKNILKPFLS